MTVEIRWPEEARQYRALTTALSDEFRDSSGTPIQIGDLVHYTQDRSDQDFTSAWTPNRWGIVTGFIKTENLFEDQDPDRTVRVTSPYVITSRKYDSDVNIAPAGANDVWYSEPSRLEIIS